MKAKRRHTSAVILFITLLFFSAQSLSASWHTTGLSITGGWQGSIPSDIQGENLPVRTHGYAKAETTLISAYIIENLSLELNSALAYTSPSLPSEGIYWKDFFTFYAGGGIRYDLSLRSSLSAGVTAVLQIPDDERGLMLFPAPYAAYNYTLSSNDARDIELTLPISLELRDDYTGVRGGAGITFRWKGDTL